MRILDIFFKKSNKVCKDKNSKYYNYDIKTMEYAQYQEKYGELWNLLGEYTQKINHYFSDYMHTNKKEDFNNLFSYCLKYIDLLPQLEEAKKEDTRITGTVYKTPYYCVAYDKLASAYEKANCYNSVINVCEEAMKSGYTDGTKGGFEARLTRIKNKQNEINNSIK